jgi:hypothetical protein
LKAVFALERWEVKGVEVVALARLAAMLQELVKEVMVVTDCKVQLTIIGMQAAVVVVHTKNLPVMVVKEVEEVVVLIAPVPLEPVE